MLEKELNIKPESFIFERKFENPGEITLAEAREIFGFGPNDNLLVETLREKYYELGLKFAGNDDVGRKNLKILNKAMEILKKEFLKKEKR